MEINSVAVFGGSHIKQGETVFTEAFLVAKMVVGSGRKIVNGGGPGIMLAATLGAKDGGGQSIAVDYKPKLATSFEGKAMENTADQTFVEANYILRTKRLLDLGDAYIVFNGGTGTISEFAMAWGLARLYFGHHKPLILYGKFWEDIMESFKQHMLVRPQEYKVFSIVTTPADVLKALGKYEGTLAKNRHEHHDCTDSECCLLL